MVKTPLISLLASDNNTLDTIKCNYTHRHKLQVRTTFQPDILGTFDHPVHLDKRAFHGPFRLLIWLPLKSKNHNTFANYHDG